MRNCPHTSNFGRMPPTSLPLSVVQAADETGIPKRTVQHAIAQRELKAHKMSGATGAYMIYRSDLNKWLAKREAKGAEQAEQTA